MQRATEPADGDPPRVLTFEAEDIRLFPRKSNDYLAAEAEFLVPFGEQITPQDVTEADVREAIKRQRTSSAAGKSGISFDLVKRAGRGGGFVDKFVAFCRAMLRAPHLVKEMPSLYKVRIVLIEKEDRSKRPIQVEESLLRLFHKVLLQKMSAPIMNKIRS